MSVEYKDYYKILGASKSASQDDMSKAYKKLARKHHPDLNPNDKKAEDKFKEINEAYEVLKDPEKRKLYDQLGPNWQHGQNFQPPPGFENVRYNFGGGAGGPGGFDAGGFSDFFETLFGGAARGGGSREYFSRGGAGFSQLPRRGQDSKAILELTLEEAFHGGAKTLTMQEQVPGQHPKIKTLSVSIPAGVKEGAKIRLAGQGNPGMGGAAAGDLYMKVHILPHHLFYMDGANVVIDLPLAPWEAALGAKVRVPTLDGAIELSIPAGTDSGRKFRLRHRGLGAGGHRGDQIVRAMIRTPAPSTDEEKALWESLAKNATFAPRDF
jgi:curved DNA-binding protein